MKGLLQIGPRYVKQDADGLRPFQRQALEAIKNSEARLIFIEAPVGSGKSHIIRRLFEEDHLANKAIVLTYPTRILMRAQLESLQMEYSKLAIWPPLETSTWDGKCPFSNDTVNIVHYSTSSLVELLRKQGADLNLDRGRLLRKAFDTQDWSSPRKGLVTSPDVLHLMINREVYDKSDRLQQYLHGGLFVFDEFHLYYQLQHFAELVELILRRLNGKVVMLSATPIRNSDLNAIRNAYSGEIFDVLFSESLGNSNDICFNYPLEVRIEQFDYTGAKNLSETIGRLETLICELPKPLAVIFDSIFRLKHVRRALERKLGGTYDFQEWSGLEKSGGLTKLNDRTVVLGTSAIEIGIDLAFRSLIMEASYWTSAVQRLGRVGRKIPGNVVILTRRDFTPFVGDCTEFDRTDFEQRVFQGALKQPEDAMVAGELFRGNSFPFLVVDADTKQSSVYDEGIFAMFEIIDRENEWRILSVVEKRKRLIEFGVAEQYADEILLRDRLVPFWGVVLGRLRQRYSRVTTRWLKDIHELYVFSDNDEFVFYGE